MTKNVSKNKLLLSSLRGISAITEGTGKKIRTTAGKIGAIDGGMMAALTEVAMDFADS